MGPANNRKCAKGPPLVKRQKPDIRFVRTPLMGKDVPVGGIELCTVYAFPVLRDRPKRIAQFLNVAGNSI